MSVSIYIKGSDYHYMADEIKYTDVTWCKQEVVILVNPKECYDKQPFEEVDECDVSGNVLIPKDNISHVIHWTSI